MDKKESLAELIGIIMGDGHLHKKGNCVTIVGSLEDVDYYEKNVIPIIKSLFQLTPKLKRRKDRNAFYIYFYSKKAMEFLSNDIGLIRGNKTNARIPKIIKANVSLIPHFLRGLFDTDGCLKFSKQAKSKHYYPRIQFCFKDSKFAREVVDLLRKMNFGLGTWEDHRHKNRLLFFQISGKENLEKWMKIVNSSNPVHKSKYLIWKKYGFYKPKSSLKERLKALNLNIGKQHLIMP